MTKSPVVAPSCNFDCNPAIKQATRPELTENLPFYVCDDTHFTLTFSLTLLCGCN